MLIGDTIVGNKLDTQYDSVRLDPFFGYISEKNRIFFSLNH